MILVERDQHGDDRVPAVVAAGDQSVDVELVVEAAVERLLELVAVLAQPRHLDAERVEVDDQQLLVEGVDDQILGQLGEAVGGGGAAPAAGRGANSRK